MDGQSPSLMSRLVRKLLVAIHHAQRWRISGKAPDARTFVLVGAPHSSNWDFVTFVGVTHDLGIRPGFVGKQSLFDWPMGRFMRDMGGIPVDRTRRSNFVEQLVAEFARRDELALVMAPEGSRTTDGSWKTGFYHVAVNAGVPVVPAWIDRKRRVGIIGAPIALTGDFDDDMRRIGEFYRRADPGNPRFAAIGRAAGDSSPFPTRGRKG